MAIYYVDYTNGNDANSGLSFALRKKILSSITPSAGDSIRIMASPAATVLGSSTWTNLSKTVTIPSGLTSNIDTGAGAWTPSVNVTATTSATRKEGTTSASLAIAAAFATGLVAYKAFAAADYSAYQQVSFFIRHNAAIGSGVLELRLCSDALGLVTVDTIAIPAIANVNLFTAITVDTGGALGASIQSVALYALSDPGTVTILLDNIIACKDPSAVDSINLQSLISKNTGSETWYAIQSINGTTVLLDNGPNASAAQGQGYFGSSETVTTYKREPVRTALTTATQVNVNASGTEASPIVISGGWNQADMTTQTDATWLSGNNGDVNGLAFAARSWVSVSALHLLRFNIGVFTSGVCENITLSSGSSSHNISAGINTVVGTYRWTVSTWSTKNNTGIGCDLDGSNCTLTSITSDSNTSYGLSLSCDLFLFTTVSARNNGNDGVFFNGASNNRIYSLTTQSNATGVVNTGVVNYLIASSIAEATEVTSATNYSDYRVYSHKHDGTTDNHQIFMDGALISSETGSDRRTASGMAWKLAPTSTNRSSNYPVRLEAARIACQSGLTTTVSVWCKRNNTGITGKLFVRGGQLNGVPSDVTASTVGSAGTYEQLTVAFTPTEAGVIEVEFHAYGGSTFFAWFDDMTISQA